MRFHFYVLLLFACLPLSAQNITLRVVEADSGQSIPFANIMMADEHLISNSEGYFTVPSHKQEAILTVSHMGFEAQRMRVSDAVKQNNIIRMGSSALELNTVNVSNIKPDAAQIMAQVKQNLRANYAMVEPSKNMIFTRESVKFSPKKLEFEVKKSTGFSKKELKTINAEVSEMMSRVKRKSPSSYVDKLFHHYSKPGAEGQGTSNKMNVIKAAKLVEKDDMASIEGMQENFMGLIFKHLDTTKFYRVKSGLFGSKDTVSFSEKPKKDKPKSTELSRSKTSLAGTMADNDILTNGRFQYVREQDIYDYTYEGVTVTGNNEFVHIIGFKPRRKKALYVGKLYISEDDYAVVRSEYKLAPSRNVQSLNLKFLLGVKMARNVSAGTVIYKKNRSGSGYYLHYASVDEGQYFYLNRPLKFTELTDSERDVFAFDLKVEGDSFQRTEFLNISRSESDVAEFDAATEAQFTYQTMHQYDPNFWKGHSAIEPLQEMKQFSAMP